MSVGNNKTLRRAHGVSSPLLAGSATAAADKAAVRAAQMEEMRLAREALRRNMDNFVADADAPDMCTNCSS